MSIDNFSGKNQNEIQYQRDERIDFLRGVCVFGMVLWHILTHPIYPYWLSFPIIQVFNFVAEGFVFLSGVSIGIIEKKHPNKKQNVYFIRAIKLLIVNYICVSTVTFFFYDNFRLSGKRIFEILSLSYQPYLSNVLTVFVFLFASVPLIRKIKENFENHWNLILIFTSIFLLISANIFNTFGWYDIFEINRKGAFDFNSWFIIFVCGIFFGMHYLKIRKIFEYNFYTYLISFGFVFVLFGIYRLLLELGIINLYHLPFFLKFDRHPITISRLIYIFSQIAIIFLLIIKFWNLINSYKVTKILISLGKNSLIVFVISIYLDYLIKAFISYNNIKFPSAILFVPVEIVILIMISKTKLQKFIN